jgi:hypothetical protein
MFHEEQFVGFRGPNPVVIGKSAVVSAGVEGFRPPLRMKTSVLQSTEPRFFAPY